MQYEVNWFIQGGHDLRIENGKDILDYDGELTLEIADTLLEDSLDDFSTNFSNEHYLIECGVWNFGVNDVIALEEVEKLRLEEEAKEKAYWDSLWAQAKHMKRTGMPLSYYRREKICPDCGGEVFLFNVKHAYYKCSECLTLFANKGDGHYFKCREW